MSVFVLVMAGSGVEAHKTITSKYKFNNEVFPILRDHCGRCHVAGGQAPMSLVRYADAIPWAESIREKLVGEAMPPWYADPSGPGVRGGYSLTTRELDILVTWATGGTPRSTESTFLGAKAPSSGSTDPPPFVPNLATWKLGPPDLALQMDAEYTLPAGTSEEIRDLTLATGLTTDRWLKAIDVLPGTPAMVRDAVISVEGGLLLAPWVPGDDVVAAPNGTALRLPAGAKLHLRIHYKKSWQDEGNSLSDRSTVGLYFTDRPPLGRELQAFAIRPASVVGNAASSPRKFSGRLEMAARVVAVRPSLDQPYARVAITAVLQDGRHVELLRLRAPQPQWYRRYWLAEPVDLPKNTIIEVTAIPTTEDQLFLPASQPSPLEIALDVLR